MSTIFVVFLYLLAIITANSVVAAFGIIANYAMSFVFIAFNLVSRDYLHEQWAGDYRRMGLLITAGSGLTFMVNRDAGPIALASFVAFASAGIVDWVVYQKNIHKSRLVKSGLSNVYSAMVDSFVFTVLAFGWEGAFMIATVDWLIKTVGGFFWAWVFFGRRKL